MARRDLLARSRRLVAGRALQTGLGFLVGGHPVTQISTSAPSAPAVSFGSPAADEPSRVAGDERARAFEVDLAFGDEHMRVRSVGHRDRLPRLAAGRPTARRLAARSRWRRRDPARTRSAASPPLSSSRVDVLLLVARIDALGVRAAPTSARSGRPRSATGSSPSARCPVPSAHALREPGVQLAAVAFGVLVLEPSGKHPGHDLHVLVRMGRETGAGRDPVVVRHEQQPVVGVVGS